MGEAAPSPPPQLAMSGGAFPFSSIPLLESNDQYPKWRNQIDDALVLNRLDPYLTEQHERFAVTAIRSRCGYNARKIAQQAGNKPDAVLAKLKEHYKPTGSGVYTDLIRRLGALHMGTQSADSYSKEFREIDIEIKEIDSTLALPEPYLVQLYLMGLSEAYNVFQTSYVQNKRFIGPGAVTFDEVTLAVRTEERRLLAQEDTVGLFAGRGKRPRTDTRSNGRKGPGNGPREICEWCKSRNFKHTHPGKNCWKQFPEQIPLNLQTEANKKLIADRAKVRAASGPESPSKKQKTEDSAAANDGAYMNFALQDEFTIRGAADPIAFMAAPKADLSSLVIVDTGCSRHAFHQRKDFIDLKPFNGRPIKGIGDTALMPKAIGTVGIECLVNGQSRIVKLPNVLLVPELGVNLLSASQLIDSGVECSFTKTGGSLTRGGLTIQASRKHGLWVLDLGIPIVNFAFNAYSVPSTPIHQLWHARMGHLGQQNVDKLPNMSLGVDLSAKIADECTCEECALGRMRAKPHQKPLRQGTYPLEVIHSDVVGKMKTTGYDGSHYFVTFKDSFTSYAEVNCIRHKSDVYQSFRRFKVAHERPDRRIKCLHIDNGGEYLSKEFQSYLADAGIVYERTIPGTPQMNGLAERFGQTLMYRAFPILLASGLDRSLWPEMVYTANYLILRSPNAKLGKTPYEAWYGAKPSLSHLRTIGSTAWAKNSKQQKLVERSTRCVLVGFEGNSIYRLWDPEKCKIVRSHGPHIQEKIPNVVEATPPELSAAKRPRLSSEGGGPSVQPIEDSETMTLGDLIEPSKLTTLPEAPVQIPSPSEAPVQTLSSPEAPAQTIKYDAKRFAYPPVRNPFTDPEVYKNNREHLDREQRTVSKILQDHPELGIPEFEEDILGDDPLHGMVSLLGFLAQAVKSEPIEPLTFAAAMSSPEHDDWSHAMDEELASLTLNNTWTLVDPPPDRKPLHGKWVYKVKRGPNNEITKFKARWVVRGFEQREGLDFTETFATVVKPMSYKSIFALAAALDWELEQMDVKTAFLYGHIFEDIYVEQPKGRSDNTSKVCKLLKALYGLKQSPRIWYNTLCQFLKTLGFHPIHADYSVFIHSQNHTIIAIYVDDILLIGPDMAHIKFTKSKLSQKFSMTDLAQCKYYLGIHVIRDRPNRTIRLSQAGYVEKVLKDFEMWECDSKDSPMEPSIKPQKAPESYIAESTFRLRYQSAVGSLMYAMLGTRPDIAYSVSVVSRYGSNPTQEHWTAVKRIFRYLKATYDYELVFSGPIKPIAGYCDASYGNDLDTRRSTSGYTFSLGSGSVSWSSKRQPTVACSTTEAELMAQTQATKEAVWLRKLLSQLHNADHIKEPTAIHCDNQGAIALSKNPEMHPKTKHIDIIHFYCREKVADHTVDLRYISTQEQLADGLTKPLSGDKFIAFRLGLGVIAAPGSIPKSSKGKKRRHSVLTT